MLSVSAMPTMSVFSLLDRRMAVRQDAPVFAAHHDRIAGNLRITQHTH
ncbi:hypothetical protein NXV57_12685 [Bacteroides thetaiotaomicron]|nr:hypothetical protein [Bacteroides thetaiotaomicron]